MDTCIKVVSILTKRAHGIPTSDQAWLQFVTLLRAAKADPFKVRSTYKRGFKSMESGKSFGYRWLEWEKCHGTLDQIKACHEEINSAVQGALVLPAEDKSEKSKENSHIPVADRHTLFIKGVSDTVEEEDLLQLFSQKVPECEINSLRLVRNQEGEKRGIAFVDVKDRDMAEKALKLNNHNL